MSRESMSLPVVLCPVLRHACRLTSHPVLTTSNRWKRREPVRKPIWLPQAPSKLFKIPDPVILPRDEQQQLDHMRFSYESDLWSIRAYCRQHFYLPSRSAGGLTPEQVAAEGEQHNRRLAENEDENRRIAADRADRLSVQRQEKLQQLMDREESQKRDQERQRQQAEQLVSREIDRSATFITKDNLLSAIDDALAHPVSYEFAIDKFGNVITDGQIHVQAFTPSATPESSDNSKTMTDAIGIKLKPYRKYRAV